MSSTTLSDEFDAYVHRIGRTSADEKALPQHSTYLAPTNRKGKAASNDYKVAKELLRSMRR